jgi:hypothetical protein
MMVHITNLIPTIYLKFRYQVRICHVSILTLFLLFFNIVLLLFFVVVNVFFLNYIQIYCVCNNTNNIDKIIDTCVYANF